MKHNHNHDNARAAGLQLVPVRFEFTHPTASAVRIAGTFNHWRPEAKTLHPEGGGRWHKETVLAPGTYEYCLVVDGDGCPTRWPKKPCPTRLAEETRILNVASRRRQPTSPTRTIYRSKTQTNRNHRKI